MVCINQSTTLYQPFLRYVPFTPILRLADIVFLFRGLQFSSLGDSVNNLKLSCEVRRLFWTSLVTGMIWELVPGWLQCVWGFQLGKWGYSTMDGLLWFISGKIPIENGWWLGVLPWLRKPPSQHGPNLRLWMILYHSFFRKIDGVSIPTILLTIPLVDRGRTPRKDVQGLVMVKPGIEAAIPWGVSLGIQPGIFHEISRFYIRFVRTLHEPMNQISLISVYGQFTWNHRILPVKWLLIEV